MNFISNLQDIQTNNTSTLIVIIMLVLNILLSLVNILFQDQIKAWITRKLEKQKRLDSVQQDIASTVYRRIMILYNTVYFADNERVLEDINTIRTEITSCVYFPKLLEKTALDMLDSLIESRENNRLPEQFNTLSKAYKEDFLAINNA